VPRTQPVAGHASDGGDSGVKDKEGGFRVAEDSRGMVVRREELARVAGEVSSCGSEKKLTQSSCMSGTTTRNFKPNMSG
jgi:hypothetical protein